MLPNILASLAIFLSGIFVHPVQAPLAPQNPYAIASFSERIYDSTLYDIKLIGSYPKYLSYIASFKSNGLAEFALINVPQGQPPANGWPIVILNHGHIAPSQYSTAASYAVPAADFANAGFMVFKPDYRGNGKSAGTADGLLDRLNYSVDVLNLLSAAKKFPHANPRQAYFWGHSMGGDVTLRALEICGNCVRAASLWAPAVTYFPESVLYFVRRNHDPAWLSRVQSELDKYFSPIDYLHVSAFDNVQLIKVPLNIHHGTQDESVPFVWGQALAQNFANLHLQYNFYQYENDNHNLSQNWATAIARDVKLFQSAH